GGDAAMVPPELRVSNVLEIFLYGGASPFESFYVLPQYGAQDSTGWYLFLNDGLLDIAQSCGFSGDLLQPFANDAAGNLVHFGPFAAPLRERADVMERVRISMTKHDAEPHEAAIPLALTGRRLGQPNLAGTGAHIQRFFMSDDEKSASQETSIIPHSYVL